MVFADPRQRFEDLLVTESREVKASPAFEDVAASEVADVGWLVLGYVFDDAGRLLLIDQPWADGWLVPGGVPRPGESLAEALVREIDEETGVEVTPRRPYALDEHTIEHERTDETTGWRTVCFAATAESTAIDGELGLADEEISDAKWFDGLPENVHNPDWTEPVYRRCLDDAAVA